MGIGMKVAKSTQSICDILSGVYLFLTAIFQYLQRLLLLIQAADWGPRVDSQRWGEFLQAEPGAGLICAYLEGYSFP